MAKKRRDLEEQPPTRPRAGAVERPDNSENDYSENRDTDSGTEVTEVMESGELSESELPISDLGLKDWFLKNRYEDTDYKVSLYRYVNPQFGERKSLVYQWTEELPSEHDIGLKYGSGRYELFVCLTDRKGKRRIYHSKFRISEEYDKLRSETAPSMLQHSNGSNGNGGAAGLDSAFNMMAKVIALITPIMQANNASHSGNGFDPSKISEMMIESYKGMNEVLKRNTLDNTQFLNDIQRRVSDMDGIVESETEVQGLTGFINSIAPLIEKFLPIFTGKSNLQTRAAMGVIKQMPAYNEVVRDKAKLNALIGFVTKKHGPEVTEKILKKLGLQNK